MLVSLDEVYFRDFKDKHCYLIVVKPKRGINLPLVTLGIYDEEHLCFDYYDYYHNTKCQIDVCEKRKLQHVFSLENLNRLLG